MWFSLSLSLLLLFSPGLLQWWCYLIFFPSPFSCFLFSDLVDNNNNKQTKMHINWTSLMIMMMMAKKKKFVNYHHQCVTWLQSLYFFSHVNEFFWITSWSVYECVCVNFLFRLELFSLHMMMMMIEYHYTVKTKKNGLMVIIIRNDNSFGRETF